MATKTDVRDYVAEYQRVNGRPCPKKAIIANSGESAESLLKELIADGSLACRRGRNGGFFPIEAKEAVEVIEEVPADTASADVDTDALAEQFRALEARLAAEEAAQNEQTDEAAPF